MDYRIFNVRTGINACVCTRGVYGHRKKVCTESWTLKEKSLAAPGESNLPQRHAGPTLYQLSYIPTPTPLSGSPVNFTASIMANIFLSLTLTSAAHNLLCSVLTTNSQRYIIQSYPQPHFER